MVDVYFRQTRYDDSDLKQVVFDMMTAMGGDAISAGAKVVIKPNLLLAAGPDKGVTTHPNVLRYVSEFVIDKGCKPVISDSPPIGSFERILSKGGYVRALSGLDVVFRPFRESAKIDIGEPFGVVDIAKEAIEADVVINLAKLKTHAQMLLTLGVKNIFGCVIGLKKPEWHFRAGTDREMFARLLVQIYKAVNPSMTIIDGILALEGQGPGKSGTPRELNLLAGSKSAIAADMAISNVLGLDPQDLFTNRAAGQLQLIPENIHVHGEFNLLDDFNFPKMGSMAIGPGILNGFMRKYVLQKPMSDNQKCRLCGECWRYCPVKAIDHHIKGIRFNYNTCIRCYCCMEICPYGAVTIKEPLLGKLFRKQDIR
ncbi:MAG: DUF362 domain-containing protein [Desulfobacterales bacterium]|nr:DUF362 domain-containing protein [Desulfobacterales bacterium]MDX2511517.1 DUF362 domain-containing protein [Desulfobacterales bacterium]